MSLSLVAPTVVGFGSAQALRSRAHALIPGGCHTYAKGDDQFPAESPPFLVRGQGCRVEDCDGNVFIEYGMGLRSTTLGHAYPPVVDAACRQLRLGCNFTRPATIEVECAEELLGLVRGADMVKFAKNGSDVTTAAVRLARGATGRDIIAVCADHRFFSVDDWFIGTTPMNCGIPAAVQELTVSFQYNNLDSVQAMFERHPGQIAAVMLEPATVVEPAEGFLSGLQQMCRHYGALLIFDEIITGFRWSLGGAQSLYGVTPDLSTFSKGLANGYSVAALLGRREIMERGGLRHEQPRVFLLSSTYGAENHGLAAALETMRIYQCEPVIETLYRQGERLRAGIQAAIDDLQLRDYFELLGRPCNLVYVARDRQRQPSQEFRTLFLQEMIRRGVIAPSLVVSYSHADDDIDATIDAASESLAVYRQALEEGIEHYLVGPPVKPVFRKFNSPGVAASDDSEADGLRVRHTCRFCHAKLTHVSVDLGMSPLCESYLTPEQLDQMERFYPLVAYVCDRCFLVQLPQYVSAAHIFSEYAYFSSYSESWLRHAKRYVEAMIERWGLNSHSQVVEVASNDGYLLRWFVAQGIPVLGIEPAANVAEAAREMNIPTVTRFFGSQTARDLLADRVRADLLVANNVLAHVPDLNDFVQGLKLLLAETGVLTVEFPHLLELITHNQFDTIYHEHFCYLSLTAVKTVFAAHGLTVFDVEELPSHGGSLRVYARHVEHAALAETPRVEALLARERAARLDHLDAYRAFSAQVEETKRNLLEFLVGAKRAGKTIVGYGAPGKGNTLLNYCGIRTDFLDYTVDRNPYKHGKYLPGTHIPIYDPQRLAETRPDYILILPWNLKEEIIDQLAYAREWGAKFVVPIPKLTICD